MKKTKQERQPIYDKYIGLYREALNSSSEYREELRAYMRQYLGSYEIDNSTEPATTVRNVTYELIESQIDPDIPFPKAEPETFSEQRDALAKSIERLCTAVREKLPFEALNDMDERYTYIYGGSVWYVEWDNSFDKVGGVRVHCLSPLDFVAEPGVYDTENMSYCFLRFTTTKSELQRKYGADPDSLTLAECEYSYSGEGTDRDTVTVVICFYKDEDSDVCRLVFSGDLILSDTPKCFRRGIQLTEDQSDGEDTQQTFLDTPTELIDGEKIGLDDKVVAVPYYVPTDFPIVIRRNTRVAPTLFGLSDCERVRPEQQAINKVESRILKKLLRAGVTPVMPEDASITLGNSIFGELIRMRPGESLDNYGKIDTTPNISQDIAEAERLYDHAKRVLGISDALQGLDASISESGFARQLKITRATARLETKKRMKYHAYSRLYRMIFRHYLAFFDGVRSLDYKDIFGNSHPQSFCRHNFIETGSEGVPYYADEYMFSINLNGGDEYSRDILWQRNLTNLNAGTLGDPSSPATLLRYWQLQKRANFPLAEENVEYFSSVVAREAESGISGVSTVESKKQEERTNQNENR